MTPIRTILHPTDFSAASRHAFELACSLARDHGARLVVLHVLERPLTVPSGVMSPPPPPPEELAERREEARQQLLRVRPDDEAIRVEHRLEEGDPATAALQVAQEKACDLIVMGTHGRAGFARLLLGSVAEKVLRGATCPVLTVKTPSGTGRP
jgi:nucleotide-binding universal stress UspA family protein